MQRPADVGARIVMGPEGQRPAWAGVRLSVALFLVTMLIAGPLLPPGSVQAAVCSSDEQLLVAPAEPRAGEPMIVAAVSRFPHERVVLSGPGGPFETTSMTVGDRFVWQATIVPDMAGPLTLTFGLTDDGLLTTQCAQLVATVLEQAAATDTPATVPPSASNESSALFASLHPWQIGGVADAPAGHLPPDADADADVLGAAFTADQSETEAQPRASSTPRPTRTPARHTGADNGNENDNESEATPTRTQTPTRTPTLTRTPAPTSTPRPSDTPRPPATDTPVPTPTLAPPAIMLPEIGYCDQPLTVRGERLGSSQKTVSGDVRIDGREATVISWSMTEIEVRVPHTARPGNSRVVEVTVAGKRASALIRLSCF